LFRYNNKRIFAAVFTNMAKGPLFRQEKKELFARLNDEASKPKSKKLKVSSHSHARAWPKIWVEGSRGQTFFWKFLFRFVKKSLITKKKKFFLTRSWKLVVVLAPPFRSLKRRLIDWTVTEPNLCFEPYFIDNCKEWHDMHDIGKLVEVQ
jgi:hypothetical protein